MPLRIAVAIGLALALLLSPSSRRAAAAEEEGQHDARFDRHAVAAPDVIRNVSAFYEVSRLKGIMKQQTLIMARIENPENDWHTCYFVRCEGNQCPAAPLNTQQFCFPAVVITGLPKCGTSALYDLLSKYKHAVISDDKENCPYSRRRSHWKYFLSLPRLAEVGKNKLAINGCIQLDSNIRLREVLISPIDKVMPKITYIVLTRNYADLIWSSYNFWCNWVYDGIHCDNTRWVRPGYHHRSPETFHDIVQGDANGTTVPHPLHDFKRPCAFAGGYFSEWLQLRLWPRVPKQHTLVFASEQLDAHPQVVASRIFQRFGIEDTGINFHNFSSYRYNTQQNTSAVDRGNPLNSIPRDNYVPGVFPISGNRPMLPETRAILDKCWQDDCVQISEHTGYLYPVCAETLRRKMDKGDLREFSYIYSTKADVKVY